MDKPTSMPVKEYLMRVMSVRTNTPLKTIEAVVDFQMQGANDALLNNYIVELSGFGKFLFNHRKAQKKMDNNLLKKAELEKMLQDPNITETKRASLNLKLDLMLKYIEDLKPKLNGISGTSVRVEEQSPTESRTEGVDRVNLSEEK